MNTVDNMFTLIEDLCQSKGITVTEMCRELKINRSSLSELKQGRAKSLSADKVIKIASFFDVTPAYIAGVEPESGSLFRNIQLLCDAKGISITEMCRLANVSRGSLTDFKNGRSKSLSTANIRKIAMFFNVTTDTLLGNVEQELVIDRPEVTKLLELARKSSKDDVELVIEILERLKK